MQGDRTIELVMALPRLERQLVRKRGHSCHHPELTETLWLFPFSHLWLGHSCQCPPDIVGLVIAIAKAKLLFQVKMHPVEGKGRRSWHMLENGNWLLIQIQGQVFPLIDHLISSVKRKNYNSWGTTGIALMTARNVCVLQGFFVLDADWS